MRRWKQAAGIAVLAGLSASIAGCTPSESFSPAPSVCYDTLLPPPCEVAVARVLTVDLGIKPERRSRVSADVAVIPEGTDIVTLVDPSMDRSLLEGYHARAIDAFGRTVGVKFVGTEGTWVDGELVGLDIEVAVPGYAGISRLEVLRDGKVVSRRTVGAQTPQVSSVTVLERADYWYIEWDADDPDDERLSYQVYLIRPDDSRELLDVGPARFELFIDRRDASEGEYRVLVIASDGLNFGWGVSTPLVPMAEVD